MDKKKHVIVMVIVVVAIAGAAFYGGTVYEKNSRNTQGLLRSNTNNGGARQFGQSALGGQPGQGRTGGMMGGVGRGGNGEGFTAGQIMAKDDKSITIKTPDGGSKIVFFSASTVIGKTTSGASSDLSNGQDVVINGQSNPDGSLTAQNIQIRPGQ